MGRPDSRWLGAPRGRGPGHRQSGRRQSRPRPLDTGQETSHPREPDLCRAPPSSRRSGKPGRNPASSSRRRRSASTGTPARPRSTKAHPPGRASSPGSSASGKPRRGRSRISGSAASSSGRGSSWAARAASGRASSGRSVYSRAVRSATGGNGSPGSPSRTRSGPFVSLSNTVISRGLQPCGSSAASGARALPHRGEEPSKTVLVPRAGVPPQAPIRGEGRRNAPRESASFPAPARVRGFRVPAPRRRHGRGGPRQTRISRGISRILKFEAMLRQ